MKKELELSIVIPAYNEEKKIAKDLDAALDYLKRYKINGEIIVSTDGVTDRTNNIVTEYSQKYSNIMLLAEEGKIGKGSALKKGIAQAEGEVIMFADAGLCVPYKYANEGLKLLKKFDCAMASRAENKSKILRKQPLYRTIGSRVFRLLIHLVLGVPDNINDTQCGFKLYRKEVAKKVYAEMETKRMMFDIEIILRLKKDGYSMSTFPVEWKNDFDTKLNPIKGSLDILQDLLHIKLKSRL